MNNFKKMKNTKSFLFLMLGICIASGCKKDTFKNPGSASLNLVNATTGIFSVYVYFTNADSNYYLQQNPVYYGSNQIYSVIPGPTPLSIVSSADTSKKLVQTSIDYKAGGIYSFFLAGLGTSVDTVITQDQIPHYSDSVAGVRFINLSPGSAPLSVNIVGNYPSQTEINGLAYKQISSFKPYSGANGLSSCDFEIRDQETGNLLLTYTWNLPLFRNQTLVINGSEDPAAGVPVAVFAVNNY
jgi:hypothetical protein